MAVENILHVVPTAKILIPLDRQRREKDDSGDEELLDSIMQHGLLHPVVLRKPTKDELHVADDIGMGDAETPGKADIYILVVGERRLRAWRSLERMDPDTFGPGIPSRFTDELDPLELKEIELHENLRRKKLAWKDECLAFREIHEGYLEKDTEWTLENTGHRLNCSGAWVGRLCSVAEAILMEDEQVLACESIRAAGAILDRRTRRVVQNELMEFEGVEAGEENDEKEPTDEELKAIETEGVEELYLDAPRPRKRIISGPQGIRSAENDITVTDFHKAANAYDGEPFNFIHCDFPYGVGIHESGQVKGETREAKYEDTEEEFWRCCETLTRYADRLMRKTCHVMLWFPMKNYQMILNYFRERDFRVDPYPLFWMKSDKVGVLPDPERGPRRIYETAFLMSRGDRRIIKSTVNAVCLPSEKRQAEHVSLKPYFVLSEFLTMFIDSDSEVLDPTCGTGTALSCATRKHAKRIMGWDTDPKAVEIAVSEVNSARLHMIAGAQR